MMELLFGSADQLKQYMNTLLENTTIEVEFVKADGSTRIMQATKNPAVIPAPKPVNTIADGTLEAVKAPTPRKQNPGVINVYDVENEGWRSITIEKIQKIRTQNMTFDVTIGNIEE